jgi:hypothetical protein
MMSWWGLIAVVTSRPMTSMTPVQDELTAAQSYIHHLETELYERDKQLEASQA